MEAYIHRIPKVELHLHIEGSLEPELMFELATKNHVRLTFSSVAAVRQAYDFRDLQSFLDIYYQGANVLQYEADFYRMTWECLKRLKEQNVRHVELFFDPQTHTERGVTFGTVINGIHSATMDARHQLDISSKLIMCFLRHLSVESALETFERALPHKDWIVAVGLDSSEIGFPPGKFTSVFQLAREKGFKAVAHAGEEGPPEYIWQALEELQAERIDHGVRCVEDTRLVEYLKRKQIPLTVCPISNVKLRIFKDMARHNLKKMLDLGLCVTVNSDDPAYFGGYVEENYLAVQKAHHLNYQDIYNLSKNGIQASFLSHEEKQAYLNELDNFASGFGIQNNTRVSSNF